MSTEVETGIAFGTGDSAASVTPTLRAPEPASKGAPSWHDALSREEIDSLLDSVSHRQLGRPGRGVGRLRRPVVPPRRPTPRSSERRLGFHVVESGTRR